MRQNCFRITFLFAAAIALMFSACGNSKLFSSYTDWDGNGDDALDRAEFVNGYVKSSYFERWSKGSQSISYDELYRGVFNDLDEDQDNMLSLVEFNSKINYFYFGLFSGKFDRWDRNSSASIDLDEFLKEVTKTDLATIWDTSDDKRITGREFAGGMFYLADSDSNGRVDPMEFNIWKVNR